VRAEVQDVSHPAPPRKPYACPGKVTINLQPSQLLQMAGRAGRRGKDTMGHVVGRRGGRVGGREGESEEKKGQQLCMDAALGP